MSKRNRANRHSKVVGHVGSCQAAVNPDEDDDVLIGGDVLASAGAVE